MPPGHVKPKASLPKVGNARRLASTSDETVVHGKGKPRPPNIALPTSHTYGQDCPFLACIVPGFILEENYPKSVIPTSVISMTHCLSGPKKVQAAC